MKKLPTKFYRTVKPQVITTAAKSFKFPSISLSIPEIRFFEAFLTPVFLYTFLCGFLFMTMTLVGMQVRTNLQELQNLTRERRIIRQQITTWKHVVEQYKGYRDGFYQLAVLEYRLGDKQSAYGHLQKALFIDPGFLEGEQLMRRIIQ